jgi:hypothetical protein
MILLLPSLTYVVTKYVWVSPPRPKSLSTDKRFTRLFKGRLSVMTRTEKIKEYHEMLKDILSDNPSHYTVGQLRKILNLPYTLDESYTNHFVDTCLKELKEICENTP